jgi:uncharacterized protein
MICPSCNNSLIVVEYNQIELDYCTQCRGVWFDTTELELLLKSINLSEDSGKLTHILQLPEAPIIEVIRKCPVCRKKMKKVYLGDEPGILVDICSNKHGMWFDRGEVIQLIKQQANESTEKKGSGSFVIDFLGEVFSIK